MQEKTAPIFPEAQKYRKTEIPNISRTLAIMETSISNISRILEYIADLLVHQILVIKSDAIRRPPTGAIRL